MNDELRMTNSGVLPSAGGAPEVINRLESASRARVVCHTGVDSQPFGNIPGARPYTREAALAAWRVRQFGGDYDPVRAVVDDAVKAFSHRQPTTDRSLWLKVANAIGWERFQELYHEQLSIMEDCRRRRNPLRNPAAAFQTRLNLHTGHGKRKGGAA